MIKIQAINLLFSIIFTLSSIISPLTSKLIPVTGDIYRTREAVNFNFQTIRFDKFSQFIKNVTNSRTGNQFVGMIAPRHFNLPITQQPAGRPDFVSSEPDIVTEFGLTQQYGSTGLLAHNHLAGAYFSQLKNDDLIILVTGNKEYKLYKVEEILSFQALSPNSPYSNFADLNDSSRVLSAVDLFMEVYTEEGSLVIQTCIAQGNEPSWGRLFIKALPVSGIGIEELLDFSNQRMRVSF